MTSPLISAQAPTARLVGTEKFPSAAIVATARQIRNLPGSLLLTSAMELCGIGDSHSAYGGSANGNSLYQRTITRSRGQFRSRGNFAVGGKRMDQMLTEQVPQAIASGARYALVQAGTNDIAQGADQATCRTRFIALMAGLIAGGIEPIVVSLFPKNAGTPGDHVKFNIWMQLYCRRENILYVNVFPLLSSVTGAYVAANLADTLHLKTPATDIVADAIIAAIRNPIVPPLLAQSDTATDNYNAFDNAMSFGGVSSAIGTLWNSYGSGGAYSVVAPGAGEQGNWLRCTISGGTGVGFVATAKTMAAVGWTIGDRIAIAANVRWVDTAQALTLTCNMTAPSFDNGYLIQSEKGGDTGESGYWYEERTITSGTLENINFRADGTGYFEINRPIAVSLTALGVA